uniref:hypothetical protein n=1 Tax=Aquisalimonas sp. TaxID=1872621 RepID=UPI0025C19E2F
MCGGVFVGGVTRRRPRQLSRAGSLDCGPPATVPPWAPIWTLGGIRCHGADAMGDFSEAEMAAALEACAREPV